MSTVKEAPSGVRSREAGRSRVIQLWRWGLLATLILLGELGGRAALFLYAILTHYSVICNRKYARNEIIFRNNFISNARIDGCHAKMKEI